MSILLNRNSKVLVQGMTGSEGSFHTQEMLDFGTQVVAGVSPGKGGSRHLGLPVFDTVAEAVDASRQLLMPPQIRFPDELESLVEWVGAAWDSGEHEQAAYKLAEALELAERLGYA